MTALSPSAQFHAASSYTLSAPPTIPALAPPRPGTAAGTPLPPGHLPPLTLEAALLGRRSARDFTGRPLALDTLSELLRVSVGTRDAARRTYPSAGGFYPNRVYVVPLRVPGLAAGVHRYHPEEHALDHVTPAQEQLATALNLRAETDLGRAAAVVFITTRLEHLNAKYGERAYRFALQESGHMAQNLLLAAAAAQLSALPLGSFLDDVAAQLLELGPGEQVLYAAALGPGASPELQPLLELDAPLGRWVQWRLYSEQPAEVLRALSGGPVAALQVCGTVSQPWYVYKADGGLHARLRLRVNEPAHEAEVLGAVHAELDALRSAGRLHRAVRTPYEAEAGLLGGLDGTQAMHDLFAADSTFTLALQGLDEGTRQGASHLWTELLLRTLGLDAFERWDVWRRVRALRPGQHASWDAAQRRVGPFLDSLQTLSAAELARRVEDGGAEPRALEAAALALAELNRTGRLSRGLRELAAIAVIFHWNRMAFGPGAQGFLAWVRHGAAAPR